MNQAQVREKSSHVFPTAAIAHRLPACGHIVESGRHMIVSGGLGTSFAPVRLGVPPEIVHMEIGA
jgi:predicted MPP superfamily phosphohydrolase